MPEIIAHRGGALLWPENSLMACRGAVALGVDQVQVDVRLSADGEVVVMHDPTLHRTTEGSGLVHQRPWSELATIRLRDAQGEVIPTLNAVVGVVRSGDARLRLELKSPPTDAVRQDLPERVVDILDRAGFLSRSMITSFATADLARIRALAPTVPLAWMLDAPATLAWTAASVDAALDLGIATIGVRYDRITRELRQSLVEAGLRLCCFGANDTAALQRSLELQPYEISTDRPNFGMGLGSA